MFENFAKFLQKIEPFSNYDMYDNMDRVKALFLNVLISNI